MRLAAVLLVAWLSAVGCGGGGDGSADGGPDVGGELGDSGQGATDGDSAVALPTLRVAINASTLTGNAPLVVDFSASIEGDTSACETLTYAWEVNTTTTYDEAEFTHTFFSSGTAPIRLELTCRTSDGRQAKSNDAVEVRTSGCADLLFDQVSLDPPVEVAPGDTVRIKQGKLYNEGDSITVPFELRVVLSLDDIYDAATDVVVATRSFETMPSGLFTESSSDFAGLEFQIPETMEDGNYFVYVVADAGLVVNECRETNNVARSTNNLTVDAGVAFKPDITVEAVSPKEPGLVVNVGQNINYTFTIRNIGVGEATSFRIAVYLSADKVADAGDVVMVGPNDLGSNVSQMAINASQGYFKSYTIPKSLPDGEYYVIVEVDALGTLAEEDETNNVATSAFPLTVAFEPPQCFDLALAGLQVSPSISYWNGSVSVKATVSNPGLQAVPAGAKVRALFSLQAALNPAVATKVGEWTLPEIAPGGQIVLDEVVKVPNSIPVKPHYVGVLLDPDGLYPECSEANNAELFPDAVVIVATASVDLVEANLAFHPATVTAGEEIKVTHTLTNTGSSAATPFRLVVALSPTPNPSAADVKSGIATEVYSVVVPGVGAGEVLERVEKVVVPVALEHSISTWYVVVVADPDASQGSDKNKANNVTIGTTKLTVLEPQGGCFEDSREPDNTLSAGKLWQGGPIEGAGSCGNEDWVRVSVPKSSSLIATLTIRPLLSVQPVSSNLDLDLTSFTGALLDSSHRSGDIEQVSVYSVDADSTFNLRVFPGSAGAKAQYDLDIEVRDSVPGVELLPDDVVALPSPLYPGGLLAVKWTDVNLGTEASSLYSARIWASKDSALDPAKDIELGVFEMDAVEAGAKVARLASVLLPGDLSGGQWRFLVQLDPDAISGDGDTGNNLASSDQVFIDVLLTCADDGLEPNNGPAIASSLDFGGGNQAVASGLVVCPELDDWYAIPVSVGQQIQVTATYPHLDSKGLIRVELWEPTGTAAMLSNASKSTSSVTLPWVWEAGTWYVRVANQAQGVAQAPYTYSLAVSTADGNPAAACEADLFEPNNAFVQPALIGCGLQTATLCRGDVDLYRVELYAKQTLEVTLEQVKGALEMRLLGSAGGTPIATKSGNGTLTYKVDTDQTVFLRVQAKGDPLALENFDYTLFMDGLVGTDLIVPQVSVLLPSVYQGEDDLVDFAIQNTCIDPSGPFAVRFWLSKDGVVDDGDVELETIEVANIAGKVSEPLSQKVSVPFSTAPGPYWVLVEADADGDVAESNEGNNENGVAVAVAALCLPDLFEPNDLLTAQSPFAPLVELPGADGLALCPFEIDWYAVQVPPGKTLRAAIHFDPNEGDLDLRVYDPGYSKTLPVGTAATKSSPEVLFYEPPVGGVVLLRVHGFDGASAVYDLELSVE
ncbi:MAG: CARDB domain-containing protein [Myxococcota bacterium]